MKLWQKSLMSLALALGLVVLAGTQADGQDKKKGDKGDRGRQGQGFQIGQQRDLVSTELQEKLKLTAEQKEKLTKLIKEYTDKSKPISDKLREARGKDGFQGAREQLDELRKIRTDYTDKVKAMLTDAQKKTFAEASQNRQGPGGNNPRPGGPGGPGGFGGFGRPADTSLFSRDVQEKLDLTAEQKEKLEKIKKALDEISQGVLSAEQKKKFEDLKKDAPRPDAGRGGRPQGGRPPQGGQRPPRP